MLYIGTIYRLQASNAPRIVVKVSDDNTFQSSIVPTSWWPPHHRSSQAAPSPGGRHTCTVWGPARAGGSGGGHRRAWCCFSRSDQREVRLDLRVTAVQTSRTLAWTYSAEWDQHKNWDARHGRDHQDEAHSVLPNVPKNGIKMYQGNQQHDLWWQKIVSFSVMCSVSCTVYSMLTSNNVNNTSIVSMRANPTPWLWCWSVATNTRWQHLVD